MIGFRRGAVFVFFAFAFAFVEESDFRVAGRAFGLRFMTGCYRRGRDGRP